MEGGRQEMHSIKEWSKSLSNDTSRDVCRKKIKKCSLGGIRGRGSEVHNMKEWFSNDPRSSLERGWVF